MSTFAAKMHCPACLQPVSVRGLRRHQQSHCPATEKERAERKKALERARYDERNARRRNSADAPVGVDKNGQTPCARPECRELFTPKSARHRCCSNRCRDAYKYQSGYVPMVSEEARMQMVEAKKADVARLAEEALARLKSPEERYRLWAACLDVPGIAA